LGVCTRLLEKAKRHNGAASCLRLNTIAPNGRLPLSATMLERIDAALAEGEARVVFIRAAIEKELKRAKEKKARPK
jgi:hypothetical protein